MAKTVAVFLLCGFAIGIAGKWETSYGMTAETFVPSFTETRGTKTVSRSEETETAENETKQVGTNSDGAENTQEENAGISMEIAYGYDNTAKGGRYLPLAVKIDNTRDTSLNGTIQVKSAESDGTVYRYDYEIEVAGAETCKKTYYIPVGTGASCLYVTLLAENGTELLTKTVKLNVNRDVPEMFIGILSDHPEELEYFNGVGIRYSTLRTRTFDLPGEEFPEDDVGLNLLDVLIVNDYKLRKLSERQTAAIMDWVHDGGLLILGTGARVDDTLGRFAPELLDDSYGTSSLRHINLGEGFALEDPSEGMLALSCVDFSLHGGNVIFSSNGLSLLTATAKEQGIIAVASFDLGDIQSFCEAHPSYVDHFFMSLLGDSRINQLSELVYSGNSSKFWSMQSLINTGDVNKLPNLALYVCVVVVYLGVLGPGMYLFLRDRELQGYYRRGVVVLSVVFAGLIYLLGSRTRFRSTFYTYASIRDVTADYVTDNTYVNIRNPYNRPYTVELSPEYSILPITRSSLYNDSLEQSDFSSTTPSQIVASYLEDETRIQGQGIPAFAPRYFQLERKQENSEQVGITGEVRYFEGKISGSITNHFPFALENTTLMLYGTMVKIGPMEAGETKKLNDLELIRFPLGDSYVVADQISGESAFTATDIRNKEYLLALERSNLLKFYLDNYLNGYTADARVLAFSTEKEESAFLKTPSEDTYGLTLLTSSLAVNSSSDPMIYRSALMKAPTVISGTYEEQTNTMGASEPLTLEYQLGGDIEVESLTLEPISEIFLKNGGGYSEAFSGGIYFYNYGSGNYDLIDLDGQTMTVDQLKPYLSPANTITVRYVYDGSGGYSSIQLPMPMVAGKER